MASGAMDTVASNTTVSENTKQYFMVRSIARRSLSFD